MFNLLVHASTCPPGSCNSFDVSCLAEGAVDHAICTAQQLLKTDPGRLYLYKRPLVERRVSAVSQVVETKQIESKSSEGSAPTLSSNTLGSLSCIYSDDGNSNTFQILRQRLDWPTIEEFTLSETVNQIRDFISMWRLTPATMCEVILPLVVDEAVPPLGYRYFVEAHFSKPTAMCPNPLAVAKVHFQIHVSNIMPKDYSIMVTYRFEGYKTIFYALGDRCNCSLRFQRLFIDTIIGMKLAFFAETCRLRHPPLRLSKQSADDSWSRIGRSNESLAELSG